MDGEAVADRLTNTCEAEQREQREAMERSLTRDEERIEVLDKMIKKYILSSLFAHSSLQKQVHSKR